MFVLITVMMFQQFLLGHVATAINTLMVGIRWEVICIHQCLRRLRDTATLECGGAREMRIYQCMRSRREIATLECDGCTQTLTQECSTISKSDGGNAIFGTPPTATQNRVELKPWHQVRSCEDRWVVGRMWTWPCSWPEG